jgi:hypothetical protein
MPTVHSTSIGHSSVQTVAPSVDLDRHLRPRVERAVTLKDLGYQFQGALNGNPHVFFVFPPAPATGCYVVRLDGPEGQATCSCPDFEIHRLPCKHIAAVCYHKREIDEETAIVRGVLAAYRKAAA